MRSIKIKMLMMFLFGACLYGKAQQDDAWNKVPEIISRIKAPTFPSKEFHITDYGAKPDGKTDCTQALKKAIEACSKAGGGMVIVSPGRYLTGAIHLKSNVNLHLEEDAELLFSQDPKDYLPVVRARFAGMDLMNYSPFVYAYQEKNIAITGKGILNGQADSLHWWSWKRLKEMGITSNSSSKLYKYSKDNIPVEQRVFGDGGYVRPNFVQMYQCQNILIEGITLINSPAWVLHPVLSRNITIQGVTINSDGPNNDGCDPESCSDVLIKDCLFNTGDDCIAIKSGKDYEGRRIGIPSENIVIRGCTFNDGHGGVVIGSEISGGVKNIFAEDCIMDSPHLETGIRIKSNTDRGGYIEKIYVRNIKIGKVADAVIRIDMYYFDKEQKGSYYTSIKDVFIRNLTSEQSNHAIRITGNASHPIRNVIIEDAAFNNVKNNNVLEGVENIHLRKVSINGLALDNSAAKQNIQSNLYTDWLCVATKNLFNKLRYMKVWGINVAEPLVEYRRIPNQQQ